MSLDDSRALQLKRGNKADLPNLKEGEPGYSLDAKEIHIGNGPNTKPTTFIDVEEIQERIQQHTIVDNINNQRVNFRTQSGLIRTLEITTQDNMKIDYLFDAQDGGTFKPTVSQEGIISWENDKNLPNPTPVSIKGPKGDGISIKGKKESTLQLPAIGQESEAWVIGRELYVWDTVDLVWKNIGEYVGPQGDIGPKGDTGDKGDTGAIPALMVGTVTTLEPWEEAIVRISGPQEAPTLDFSLPKGIGGNATYMGHLKPHNAEILWFDTVEATDSDYTNALTEEVRKIIGEMRNQIVELSKRVTALESNGGSGSDFNLLTENGLCLITESGDYLRLE